MKTTKSDWRGRWDEISKYLWTQDSSLYCNGDIKDFIEQEIIKAKIEVLKETLESEFVCVEGEDFMQRKIEELKSQLK